MNPRKNRALILIVLAAILSVVLTSCPPPPPSETKWDASNWDSGIWQ